MSDILDYRVGQLEEWKTTVEKKLAALPDRNDVKKIVSDVIEHRSRWNLNVFIQIATLAAVILSAIYPLVHK